MKYDFRERVEFSKGKREQTDIATLRSMIDGCTSVVKTDLATDKSGVDYIATLRRGAKLHIDAKTREKGCSRYWTTGDAELALEKWSVIPTSSNHGAVGWTLCESKDLDLVFFKFHPDDCKTGYLFSYHHLRMAFRRNCLCWEGRFKVDTQTTTHNGKEWQSQCVFVPIPVVEHAIKKVRRAPIQAEAKPIDATKDLFGDDTGYTYQITNPRNGEYVVVRVYKRGDTVTLKYNTGQVLTWSQTRWEKAQEDLQIKRMSAEPFPRRKE